MKSVAEIIDLRQFQPAQLDSVLAAEAAEWLRELHWDYSSSLQLIRQYMEAKILPGYVLIEGHPRKGTPQGYGFFVYESQKGLIGDLFVHPSYRARDRMPEKKILHHMLETMQATPGLRRIEAQLMAFFPSELSDAFRLMGFRAYRRLFMYLRLKSVASPNGGGATRRLPVRLEPWGTASLDAAATLINRAYQNHIDSEVNDQYCTFAGSLRFLNNVIQYPGCGTFDEAASALARNNSTDRLEGMILASRVKEDVAHITQICVSPERQSKGIGRALLARTVDALRRRKFEGVTLTVTQANAGAVALYEKFGFITLRDFDAYVWERQQ